MKRALALAALWLSPAAPLPALGAQDTFTAAVPNMPATLDPAALYERQALTVCLNMYDTLIGMSGSDFGEFVPALSRAVPTRENGLVSEDGLTYTFPLRTDVKFQDGTPLTAEDARYSLLRIMLMDYPGGPGHLYLQPILGVDRTRDPQGRPLVDFEKAARAVQAKDGALVIRLAKPFRPFLSLVASWPFVMSKSWAVSLGEWDGSSETWRSSSQAPRAASRLRTAANGTGPYRLSSVDEANEVLVLERNPHYWGAPGDIAKAVFTAFSSEDHRVKLLAEGTVDYTELSRETAQDAKLIAGVAVDDGIPNYTTGKMVVFSWRVDARHNRALGSGRLDGQGIPPDFFSDPDVRKGFAFAFDAEGYDREILAKRSRRVYGPVPFLPKVRAAYAFDPAKAAGFLKRAHGGDLWRLGFKAEIAYSLADDEAADLAGYLARNLLQLNPRFILRPRPLHPATLLRARDGRLPISIDVFGPDYIDWNTYAFNLMHSQGLFPRMQGYANPEADRIVHEAMNAPTKDERLAWYGRLQDVYNQDVPQLYAAASYFCRASRRGVSGLGVRQDVFGSYNHLDLRAVRKAREP